MSVIDDYLQKIEISKRLQLERIRTIAKKVVPQATETISYGMPTMQYKGKSFLGFNVHTNHIGIYPYGGEEIEAFKEKLALYKTSKGAIQIPFDKPISEGLLTEIILHRVKRIEAKA